MFQKAPVTIKGVRDGIAVDIDEKADFYTVIEILRQKVAGGKRFFAGANINVYFRGRKLTTEEEDVLALVISQVAGVSVVTGLPEKKEHNALRETKKTPDTEQKQQERSAQTRQESKTTPKGFNPYATETVPLPTECKKNYTESNTAFYSTSLRSGQSIKYAGSVVVMGDVNPGSEVVAEGNVIVMGSLKGLAHAGASGDESSFISALVMQPVQLRIAGVISSMAKTPSKKPEIKPSYAYIKDGKINIAAL